MRASAESARRRLCRIAALFTSTVDHPPNIYPAVGAKAGQLHGESHGGLTISFLSAKRASRERSARSKQRSISLVSFADQETKKRTHHGLRGHQAALVSRIATLPCDQLLRLQLTLKLRLRRKRRPWLEACEVNVEEDKLKDHEAAETLAL